MEDRHPPTRRLKRAEPAGAWSPAASRRRRLAFVREGPSEPRRSEEREGEPPLPLPYSGSSEKTTAPSEPGEIVSGSFASSSSSSPLEPPRPSARSDEDSVDVVNEKLDVVVDGRQQAKSSETESSTCNADFRETTPPSEATAKSPTTKPSPEKPTAAAEMPSRAELESFFSAAEKRERQRFAERYNYDVVADVPLEGRYEWIRLKP